MLNFWYIWFVLGIGANNYYLLLILIKSKNIFVIDTCYIDHGVSLLLIFDIVFIFYKTLPVHCI